MCSLGTSIRCVNIWRFHSTSSTFLIFIQNKIKLRALDQLKSIQLYTERSGPKTTILPRMSPLLQKTCHHALASFRYSKSPILKIHKNVPWNEEK